MKKKLESIPTFKTFTEKFDQKKLEEAAGTASRKLQKATEEYHDAQLKLQELQNEFIKTKKEDTSKREQLKKAIVAQNALVKQKEATFSKALGDEDIDDLEI
jgi:hypothetical protein